MIKYSAFIITYRRPEILRKTIQALLNQTVIPSVILIVDNDVDCSAEKVVSEFPGKVVEYIATGSNMGPAGGAYFGLKTLYERGEEWMLWVDDDDPPTSVNQIETILNIKENYTETTNEIGVLGASGVLYDYNNSFIKRVGDQQLKGIIEVDMIAGNQFPIVHKRVIDAGVLPDPSLFFGFEDLEFGIRVKQNGFHILVDGSEVERLRTLFNRKGKVKNRGKEKKISHLWREYYSVRTIAYIHRNNHSFFPALKYVFRNLIKSIFSFRYGIRYGVLLSKYLAKGQIHGYSGKMGLTELPLKKY